MKEKINNNNNNTGGNNIKDDIEYLLLLHNIGISQKKLNFIFKKLENYREVYDKLSYLSLERYGIGKKQIEYILQEKKKINLDYIENNLKKRNTKIITIKDKLYPENLRNISNPPYILYVRGEIDFGASISIVGARKITPYGEKVIQYLLPELSKYFTIISGGAAGCDTLAHKETLISNGKTISVIGTGINIDYPVQNNKLYSDIVEKGGAIISIFPFMEVGNPYNFPIRNELVAGLSTGVLIIEAKEKSGSLITAGLALDLGKDLFAIPGDIFKSTSAGCNNLILKGEAKLVKSSEDILGEYNISYSSNKKSNINRNKIIFSDSFEESIYKTLTIESYTMDELSIKLGYNIQTLNFKISMMEINLLIKKIPGGKYEII